MKSNVEKLEQLYSLLNVIQHVLDTPNSDLFANDISNLIQIGKDMANTIKEELNEQK